MALTILPSEIDQAIVDNITRFDKKFELRVKLWQNSSNTFYDMTGTDYDPVTGIYTLP